MWIHDCVNIVIVVRKKKSTKFEIYSYNPFIFNKSGKRGLIYQLSYNDTFFPNKIKNLHGYEIRVSMHPRPPYSFLKNFKELDKGTEVEILKSMISTFNFTPVIITSREDANDYVVQLQNGSQNGLIGDLLINKLVEDLFHLLQKLIRLCIKFEQNYLQIRHDREHFLY